MQMKCDELSVDELVDKHMPQAMRVFRRWCNLSEGDYRWEDFEAEAMVALWEAIEDKWRRKAVRNAEYRRSDTTQLMHHSD